MKTKCKIVQFFGGSYIDLSDGARYYHRGVFWLYIEHWLATLKKQISIAWLMVFLMVVITYYRIFNYRAKSFWMKFQNHSFKKYDVIIDGSGDTFIVLKCKKDEVKLFKL